MIKKLIILLFFLFMLNLSYQPVFRTTVRYKTPVTYSIKVDADKNTGMLIRRNKEFYTSEKIFLYICFIATDLSSHTYYNSS